MQFVYDFQDTQSIYLPLVLTRMRHTELSSLGTPGEGSVVYNVGVQINKTRVDKQVPKNRIFILLLLLFVVLVPGFYYYLH